MEQIKATNALAPFVALSKSATSPRAAADLITRATSAPGTFIFATLLSTPQIQSHAVSSDDFKPYFHLLEIFSYGTYQTYVDLASSKKLPALDDAQALKLRQLSLLTLSIDSSNLTYTALLKALNLDSVRKLEELVISTIYAGLIQAQLNPSRQCVEISSVAPLRDVTPQSIPSLVTALEAWSNRCTNTLAEMEAQIQAIRSAAARNSKDRQRWNKDLTNLVEDEKMVLAKDMGDKEQLWLRVGGTRGDKKLTHFGARGRSLGSRARGGSPFGGGGSNKRLLERSRDSQDETLADEDEDMEIDDSDQDAENDKKRASRRRI